MSEVEGERANPPLAVLSSSWMISSQTAISSVILTNRDSKRMPWLFFFCCRFAFLSLQQQKKGPEWNLFAFFFFFLPSWTDRLLCWLDTQMPEEGVLHHICHFLLCLKKTNNVSAVLVNHCQCNCILYDKDCFSTKGWDSFFFFFFFYFKNEICAFT